MAGEWIAYDLALPEKPEVQELIDITGEPVEVVIYRMLQLWGWASLHCADGRAKMTPPRLCRVCGGTIDFWQAVESVGWLKFDAQDGTVAVSGWDRRFSQSAKERAAARNRAAESREKHPEPEAHAPVRKKRTHPCASGAPEERRGDREEDPPPPRDAAQFEALRAAWNKGHGRPWKPHTPPKGREGVADDPQWLKAALEAIPRLAGCRYFETPVTLPQFMGDGFVTNVLGGQYDNAKATKGGRPATRGIDEPAPPREWKGDDLARFEATRAKALAALQEAS
jgi:hypothetical protein